MEVRPAESFLATGGSLSSLNPPPPAWLRTSDGFQLPEKGPRLSPSPIGRTAGLAVPQTARRVSKAPAAAPETVSKPSSPHKSWGGPSAEEVFGDRLLSLSHTPYRLLGVFAVRAKDVVVSAAVGANVLLESGDDNCVLEAMNSCLLPPSHRPPRGLLARPALRGLLDVFCNGTQPYMPPLYASRQPPPSYPSAPVEESHVRIVSQLEDFLKGSLNLSIMRPAWDHRESPYQQDRSFMRYRRMLRKQELQQQHHYRKEEEQQRQQHRRRCAWPASSFEQVKQAVSEVSIQRNLQQARKGLRKTVRKALFYSLLSARDTKRVKDFWRLRRAGGTLLWEFEGVQVQDIEVSPACLLLLLLLLNLHSKP